MHDSTPPSQTWQLEREVFRLRTLLEVAQALADCRESAKIFTEVLAILSGTFGAGKALAIPNAMTANGNAWLAAANWRPRR